MRDDNREIVKKKKLTLGERLKDKRERAKLELMLYGIFFLVVIVFARFMSSGSYSNQDNNSSNIESFVLSIEDNYEYDILVTIDDNEYQCYGKMLGNNGTINVKDSDNEKNYYLINKKYYILLDGNYMLADEKEVYPYIDYRYLDVSQIKQYIETASKEDGVYIVRVSDILLNSESTDNITISINEKDKNVVIDYTNLFKLIDATVNKVMVNITYSNIDNIISLDE